MMSPEIEEAMIDLRKFMFENVYKNPVAKGEEVKAKAMIEQLFYFYKEHLDQLPAKYPVSYTHLRDKPGAARRDA